MSMLCVRRRRRWRRLARARAIQLCARADVLEMGAMHVAGRVSDRRRAKKRISKKKRRTKKTQW